MMKRSFALVLCLTLLLLTACGRASDGSGESTTESVFMRVSDAVKRKDVLSANDSYGLFTEVDDLSVEDVCVHFRTKDSYRLEAAAVRAALELMKQTLAKPESLQIMKCNILNCAEDKENVYYKIYFNGAFLVGSGDEIKRGDFYEVGVRKADGKTFDAAEKMETVVRAYSVFEEAERDAVISGSAQNADAFTSAVREILVTRFKNPDRGMIVSSRQRPDESDETDSVWDILCEGENDFGMRIRDIYTIYFHKENGKLVEFDPAD